MHEAVVRHQIRDVRNEDYYWLPWDESMIPAKKNAKKKEELSEEKAKKPVYVSISRLLSHCSVTKPGVHIVIMIPIYICHSTPPPPIAPEPEPMEGEVIPDLAQGRWESRAARRRASPRQATKRLP